jgi:hypothetical protein
MTRSITKQKVVKALATATVGDELGPTGCDVLNLCPGGRTSAIRLIEQRLSSFADPDLLNRYNSLFESPETAYLQMR